MRMAVASQLAAYNTPQYHAQRFQAGYMPVDPSIMANMSPNFGLNMPIYPQQTPQSPFVPGPAFGRSSDVSAPVLDNSINPALNPPPPTLSSNDAAVQIQSNTFNQAFGLLLPTASNSSAPAQGQTSTFNSAMGLHLPVVNNNTGGQQDQQHQQGHLISDLGLHAPALSNTSMPAQEAALTATHGLHHPSPADRKSVV